MSITANQAISVSRDLISMALCNVAYARSAIPKHCFRDRIYIGESGRKVVMKKIVKGAHIEGDRLLSFIEDWIFSALENSRLSSISLIITGNMFYTRTKETFTIDIDSPYGSYTGEEPCGFENDGHQISPTQVGEDLFALIHRLTEVTGSMDAYRGVKSFEVKLAVEKTPQQLPLRKIHLPLPYQTRKKETSTVSAASQAKQQTGKENMSLHSNEIGTLNTAFHQFKISKSVSKVEFNKVNTFQFPTPVSVNCSISLESFEYDTFHEGFCGYPVAVGKYTWLRRRIDTSVDSDYESSD